MPESSEKTRSVFTKVKDFASFFISIIALALSCYSLYNSERSHRDQARADAIKTEYDLFNSLGRTQLEHPIMSHLFAVTGEHYNWCSTQATTAAVSLDSNSKAKLLLEERSVAHSIFIAFEESYYNWKHAELVGDVDRALL